MARAAFTYVDLFAGIGGFHAALSALGGRCVAAVEWDAQAAAVYKANWGIDPFGDVTEVANDEEVLLPDHDVLAAGFPCQPFSKSGAQQGMEETRGTLYWHVLRVIEARRPAVVLLENVRNLAGPRHRHEWAVIVETLRDEGYRVSDVPAVFSPHLLPRSLGGRPQVRERVFITATRADGLDGEDLVADPPVWREAVGGWDPSRWRLDKDLPLDPDHHAAGCDLTDTERLWIDAWDDFVRRMRAATGRRLPGFPLWADDWVPLGGLDVPDDTPRWKRDFLIKNATFYENHRRIIDPWADRWGIYGDRFPPSRRKLEWQAQDLPGLWDTVMHLRPSGIRAKAPTYLPALVAITQTSVIGPRERRLSPREAARLQGLPDGFSFGDQSPAATYRQLGNGVSIGAVWHVLKGHAQRDQDLLRRIQPRLLKAILNAPESPDPYLVRRFGGSQKVEGTTVTPMRTNGGSGSEAFDRLRATMLKDPALRQELEWLLRLAVEKFNPSDRGNRWAAGGIVEWALALAAFNAGVVALPEGHNSDGHDLVDMRDQARSLWSVKSSFQNRRSAFIITNGLGGAGAGLVDTTVFLHPLLPGIVLVDPQVHGDVAARTEAKGGETRLPFLAVADHAARNPECVAALTMPTNEGVSTGGDAALDAVRVLMAAPIFSRLSRPLRIVEDKAGGDVVTRLFEVRSMIESGALTEAQGQSAIEQVLGGQSATA